MSAAESAATIETFTASDGYRWQYRRYEPANQARGVFVCLHGIQSHGGWYEYSSKALCAAGYRVLYLDRRGAGLNDEARGDAPSFGRLLDDIAEFLSSPVVQGEDNTPTSPIVLMAISWGGKLAVALQRWKHLASIALGRAGALLSPSPPGTPEGEGRGEGGQSPSRPSPPTPLPRSTGGEGRLFPALPLRDEGQGCEAAHVPSSSPLRPRPKDHGLIDALILLCPGFFPQVGVPLAQLFGIVGARLVSPIRHFPIPLSDADLFTASHHWRKFIRADPLALHHATARLLVESVRLDRYVRRSARFVTAPTLLLLAGQDRIIRNDKTQRFFHKFASADKNVITYAHAHHTLEFEPDPDRHLAEIVRWLDRRYSASGPRSAE